MNYIALIATELNISEKQVGIATSLFAEGATVPFIARYRKDMTGSLDETQLRDIQHKSEYYKELDERKVTIIKSIEEQGKMTPALKKQIEECMEKVRLEDIYLPYKPKRRTRATIAKDLGLEPLARIIEAQETTGTDDIEVIARIYLSEEKGLTDPKKAIAGALDILAEEVAENAEYRQNLRQHGEEKGQLTSEARKEFKDKKTKFDSYYEFAESIAKMPSHRVLAVRRGEKEKVLKVGIKVDDDLMTSYLKGKVVTGNSPWKAHLETMVEDSYNRLMKTSMETELRLFVKKIAEEEALKVFSKNLRDVLLAPPAGQKSVLALDPGFKSGVKVAILDTTGKYITNDIIYPHPPQSKVPEAMAKIRNIIIEHKCDMIAIGNGTASRETDAFVAKVLSHMDVADRPIKVVVNESGASVYSASVEAIREYPNEDVTTRGTISIGRRLQDPLAELVKVDPKAIGVGQYQHDVNQTQLKKRLDEVVESCVNTVGVNLNTASDSLLSYVAGISKTLAQGIVKYRDAKGMFTSREAVLDVPKFGPKVFEQSAGFLRITDAENPLDGSAVHPENYTLVGSIAQDLGIEVKDLVGNEEQAKAVSKDKYISDDVGIHTLEDILSELEKPNRDPRKKFTYAKFNEKFQNIQDLVTGSLVEGVATNVTNFGAFIDIGVHQDGLLHVSEMSETFVEDAKTVLSVGDIVKVYVMAVDVEQKRISLTMKQSSMDPGAAKRGPGKKGSKGGAGKKGAPQQGHATLADLKQKLKGKSAGPQKQQAVKPKISLKSVMRGGR
ncbi:MAG: RNA-binding transcriptional accessory protein [Fibrobacterales bacterium]